MVQNFKVFMYEPNITQFKFGTQTQVESLFYSSLRNSSYIIQQPEEANLLRAKILCFPTRQDWFVPHHKDLTLPPLRSSYAPVKLGPLNDMPFVDVLRWRKMAVFVKSYVKVDTDTWRKQHEFMKRLGVVASEHLQWNRSPMPLDAFNTIMYQLWLRRHTVRYKR
ncbi:uncharacterized protein [Cicer arietinum]|uniref:Uncharacterized protein LOC101497852 n=1 Tax=Cicer arietinum TaxID=3827 RepID=A0A1S2Z7Z1_CICAR|nr:uncharacterized protein LOC101497852 [Cicer arietinum]